MITVDFNPDEKKLKEFGFFSLGGFLVIGLISGPEIQMDPGGGMAHSRHPLRASQSSQHFWP